MTTVTGWLHMGNLMMFIVSIGLEEDSVLITCLYLLYLRLFCSLKQAKLGQFSIFLIQNRTIVCTNQLYLTRIVVFYGATHLLKHDSSFTVHHIILLTLCLLYRSADWIGMLTISSTTYPRNSILVYCIFMP